ncbi:MAG: hypothetical protein ACJ8DZ_14040 [Allosphingosinicella sp.]
MAEYRIVAKIDPAGVTSGSAKIRQDLRGVDTAVTSTKQNISRAFDGPGVERALGNLISRLHGLESSMLQVASTSSAVATANTAAAASLDRIASSGTRANAGAKGAAGGQASMEAATRRVLQAVDQEAAELARLNKLLTDARMLHEQGAISADTLAKTEKHVADETKRLNSDLNNHSHANGMARIGQMELTHAMRSTIDMIIAGQSPLTALSLETSRAAQGIGYMAGESKLAKFMMGEWGMIIMAGVTVLGMLIPKLFSSKENIGDLTKKMKEDAQQAELTRQAHERYNTTLEGMIENSKKLNSELERTVSTQRQVEMGQLAAAQRNVAGLKGQADDLRRQIADTNKEIQDLRSTGGGAAMSEEAASSLPAVIAAREAHLRELNNKLTAASTQVTAAERGAREAEQPLLQRDVEAAIEGRTRATEAYTRELGKLNAQLAIGAGNSGILNEMLDNGTFRRVRATGISRTEFQDRLDNITRIRDAAIKAAQDADNSDGVSRFRSRQQAIGIAGREFLHQGLGVSENEQFGGVHSNHPGMGNSAHGQFAVDVNQGSGNVEANVPDMKARFDELARRYQARGYRVLWNGQVYEANGNGPSGPITHGDQHRDHMHVEAPQSIVGKATQSAEESSTETAEQRAARVKEQKGDFVQGIVDEAASRGLGSKQETLAGKINKVMSDFKRRFNEEMGPEDAAKVKSALSEADMREARQHFEENYIQPLQRLKDLQGKTGVEREILNTQLSESARLGRDLSAEEAQAIRNLYESQSKEEFDNTFVKPLERLEQAQGATGIGRKVLNAQMEESIRVGRELTDVEKAQIDTSVRRTDQLSRENAILEDVHGPLEEYKAQIAALTELLSRGEISQTKFNAGVAQLGASTRNSIRDMPGRDPNGVKVDGRTYSNYGDIAAAGDEQARYTEELSNYENHQQMLLDMGIDYHALIEAAQRRHVQNMNAIDQARKQVAVSSAMSTADSLVQIAEASIGKQNAVYKALFIASKAFAIADAIIKIQQGIANAMALPFPANLAAVAAVAAAAASIVSSIQAVSLNLRDGGIVRGPGGPRDDRVRANLSDGEFVVNADATSRNRALLEAINNGAVVAGSRRVANDNGANMRGSGDSFSFSFGDVVVPINGNVTRDDGRAIGREVREAIGQIVDEKIKSASRAGGALTRTQTSVMASG